jgi:hypothetical protein
VHAVVIPRRHVRGTLQFQQRSRETIAGAPASPTPQASLGRVCQAFSRISITLFASSSEAACSSLRRPAITAT